MIARAWRGRVRRGLAPGVLAAAVALFAAAPAAQAQALSVTPGGGPPFPARTLLLTAPGSALNAGNVHVVENGRPVGGLLVTPLSGAHRGDYGVVLVIDTSASMAGSRMAVAMAAARSLAAGLSAGQEIGVIEFNGRARVVLPLTTDRRAIDRALAGTPATGGATHIFDAAAVAERELAAARVSAGAVLVLSAGDDRGSRLDANGAYAPGRAAHYAIYAVAMRHPSFAGEDLAELAAAGGGTLSLAEPAQVHETLLALEARITSRYVVHYRSLQRLAQPVSVNVSVDGIPGSASLSYTSPTPPHAGPNRSFWTSKLALFCFSFAAALLLALATLSVLLPRIRRENLKSRVAHFTGATAPAIVSRPGAATERSLFDGWEDSLRESPRWQRLNEELEIAGIGVSPLRLAAITAIVTVAVAVLLAAVTGLVWVALPMMVIGPWVSRAIVQQRLRHRRQLFSDGLAAHLQEIASAMRAGHSVVGALRLTADGAAEPAQSEFLRVVADEQLGQPLSVALAPVARRMACPDIGHLALIASVHDRSGGNMAEVLDRLAESVRERTDLRRELKSLTAQARLSRYVVTALPPAVVGILALVNPGYLNPLFNTTTGVILLLVCSSSLVAAYFVMRKIVEIEV